MPTFSEITIEFDREFQERTILDIKVSNGFLIDTLGFEWVNTRVSDGEVEVGTPTVNLGETSAINFKTAFDLDYPTGYVTSIIDTNKVLIQSEDKKEEFLNVTIIHHDRSDIPDAPEEIINHIEDSEEHKIKYYISYCDDFGTSRSVFILKKGHTAGATELLADVNPISIDYESSEDFKFSPIRSSLAEVFLIFDSEGDVDFEEFWTADEKEYQIQDIKDGSLEWIGYVVAGGFEYEFKGGKYYASLKAIDGLNTLESLTFVDDNLKPYGNQDLVYNNGFEFPFSLIITEILKKLKLDLDLWTCIDSYERTMTKTGDVREADPLSASFVNVKTYIKLVEDKTIPYWYGSGEEWNCKEVLENILYLFGAKLYQEYGVWRIKSINVDVDYGTGDTQRYWRKYNTVGTYLGNYELVNDEVNIPCDSITKLMIGNDHVMSMDDVYKAFRMNYEYTLLRDGDTPLNLIKNGDFLLFDDTSVLSAPNNWARVRESSIYDFIRLKSVDVIEPNDVGGYTKAIEIGVQRTGTSEANTTDLQRPETGLVSLPPKAVKNNDSLFFEIWSKYIYKHYVGAPQRDLYCPMFRMVLVGDDGDKYFLRNGENEDYSNFVWELSDDDSEDIFTGTTPFNLLAPTADNYNEDNDYVEFWYNHKGELPTIPISGDLYFMIHGIAILPVNIRGRHLYKDFPCYTLSSTGYRRTRDWKVDEEYTGYGYDVLDMQTPRFTGVIVGLIPSGDDLPEQQDYVYNNVNDNYTLQVDPITVYNGDVQDEKHISNIIVPTNIDGSKNFWDDIADTYGSSSLGLLTVREIMRQYQKPYRIFEGTIKIQDARFGSVYTFSAIPNVRFILQRGSFNKQKQYIEDATFVQISSDELPNGGFEGNHDLNPFWIETGNYYCEVGEDALNTGYVTVEEIDINPNSETYQETREVISDSQDLTSCPLSTPREYYWNTDDVYLDTDALKFSPFVRISDNEIQIEMSNDEGNYLYLVHLKSIGVVERITTLTTPSNVLSDWVYLDDVTIDGYIYRVLRTDYVMTEFTDFTHNFKFN